MALTLTASAMDDEERAMMAWDALDGLATLLEDQDADIMVKPVHVASMLRLVMIHLHMAVEFDVPRRRPRPLND